MKKLVFLFFLALGTTVFPQNFKFTAMCDSRGPNNGVNEPVLTSLISHMMKNFPDQKLNLFPGDMINGSVWDTASTVQQLKHWKEVMSPLYNNPKMTGIKVYPTPGNHELRNRSDIFNYLKLFPGLPDNGPADEKGVTYSFDYKGVHFVSVATVRWELGRDNDTTDDKPGWHYVKSFDWLAKDLKKARKNGAKHIIVFGHESAFPIGGHLRDGLPNLGTDLKMPLDSTRKHFLAERDKFWKLLKDNKVKAYVCGHEHIYGRQSVDGVYQIVSGSSGAPIYYFNSRFGDNPEKKRGGQELTYNEALPYYEALNYNHAEGDNCQASKDFFGLRAYEYMLFDVKGSKISVSTYGIMLDDINPQTKTGEVKLLDKFELK